MVEPTALATLWPRAAVALVGAALCGALFAGEVLRTELSHSDGRFTVAFDVRIHGDYARVRRVLTDYAQYTKHFDSILESKVLKTNAAGERVKFRVQSCVLFFCKTVTAVKDIVTDADGTIHAVTDPKVSDFQSADERWRITRDGNATRLRYNAEIVPAFYSPPFIGPWLVKRHIRRTLERGANTLERVAADE